MGRRERVLGRCTAPACVAAVLRDTKRAERGWGWIKSSLADAPEPLLCLTLPGCPELLELVGKSRSECGDE